MAVVKKSWFPILCLVFVLGIAVLSLTAVNAAQPETSDAVKIASLVKELNGLSPSALGKLEALPIRAYEIPPAGVDVMRARLTETYSVDGVGTDEVELTGWIAVRHGQARPVEGAVDLNWNTAVLTTEFVGMDLQGHSKVFGPVRVRLDESRRSIGSVGQIEIPAKAKQVLLADATTASTKTAPATTSSSTKTAPATSAPADDASTATIEDEGAGFAACEAAANVTVEMPELQLAMQTKSPVSWYSLVTTIPPVGHTASIAIEPVRLISSGREVGTLESGEVHFRELVRHERLSDDRIETASSSR